MRALTVGHLRELIKDAPPQALVLMPYSDHSLKTCQAFVGTVMVKDGEYCEDHGEDVTPEGDEYGKRVRAVIVS